MATFLRGDADPDGTAPARRTPSPARGVSLLAGLAVLGLLTACGSDDGASGAPTKLSGTAGPASGTRTTDAGSGSDTSPSGGATPTGAAKTSASASVPAAEGSAPPGGRCHTPELRASVGDNDPGAGQENFAVVLTNRSSRTCTVRGFPGAAFVDASGKQLGPDPKRSSEKATTVTLAPGRSAWAGLTFSNPEISGAGTATPATLLVTPPDEKAPLKVKWTQGDVPVSGNASTVSLTVLRAGSGT